MLGSSDKQRTPQKKEEQAPQQYLEQLKQINTLSCKHSDSACKQSRTCNQRVSELQGRASILPFHELLFFFLMVAQSLMSFSSPCVKSNEALQKRNTSMSIDIGPTNHLDTEENWKQEQWYNCVLLSPPFKMCFYVNELPFFSVMELWVSNQLISDMHQIKLILSQSFGVLTDQICQILVVV